MASWPLVTQVDRQIQVWLVKCYIITCPPILLLTPPSVMAAKERSERSGNFTTLKFQVVRIWNLANLTLEEIFPDSWFPVLLHLDFGYLDCWAYTHICSSCREYYFKYKELIYLSHTLVCTFKISRHANKLGRFYFKITHMCAHGKTNPVQNCCRVMTYSLLL